MAEAPKVKIPDAIKKYIQKDSPKEARLMAAKASLPMSPLVQVTVLTYLSGDSDPEVAGEAKKSMLGMPPAMLKNTLKEKIHPKTLDFFAKNKSDNSDLVETILLNKFTPDESFVHLAEKISGKTLDIIAANQQRMLKAPDIANALKRNPNAPKSMIERTVSFLRMAGVQIEGESPILTQDEINTLVEQTQKKRQEFKAAQGSPFQQKEPQPDQRGTMGELEEDEEEFYESEEADYGDMGTFEEDELYGGEDLFEEKEHYTEEEIKNFASKVAQMSVAQKVKLALLGNKEVRGILIKDSNKIVSTSVIRSPKLTDNEVHAYAQMRSICDEVIRYIAKNKDWSKNYSIKLALATNPKTPLSISIKFLQFLNTRDTAELSRNRNVSPQLQKLAKERHNRMRGG